MLKSLTRDALRALALSSVISAVAANGYLGVRLLSIRTGDPLSGGGALQILRFFRRPDLVTLWHFPVSSSFPGERRVCPLLQR